MFAHSKTENVSNTTNAIFDFLKGLIISILLSLGLVIVFAVLLKWFNLPDSFVVPITFVIKYLSIIVGSCIAVKGSSKGLIKGAFFGILYTCIATGVFSFLAKSFSLDLSTLLDLASSILLGAIVGIVKVNKK